MFLLELLGLFCLLLSHLSYEIHPTLTAVFLLVGAVAFSCATDWRKKEFNKEYSDHLSPIHWLCPGVFALLSWILFAVYMVTLLK